MKNRFLWKVWALLLISIVLPLSAMAQQGPVVKSIDIQYAGPSGLSKERILNNMRTAVGRPYSEQAVEEDIRNLYSTGLVNNVRIFGEPSEGGVKVIVVVQAKATIEEVTIQGADRISEKRLRKEITLKKGDPLNEAMLEQDKQKMLTLYQEKNYTDATITYRTDVDEKTGKVRVSYSVNEGGKTVVKGIQFEGNSQFNDKALRKVIKTQKHNLLSFLTKSGRVQTDVLDEDVSRIREHYQNAGYIDVQVAQPEIVTDGGGVDLVFRINEGDKYTVGTVSVAGTEAFSNDEVMAEVRTAPGGVFSPQVLRADNKRISDLYGSRGYVDLQVDAETSTGGKNLVNVNYRLSEGNQSYIERVNISGNTRTKDKVIRRELAVAPGDVYNTVLVDASKQRLQGLNYFEKVESYPATTAVEGRKDLNVVVEEKRTGSFNFGAGFSSVDNLLGFVEVQQSNFDIMNPWAFTGGGQRFRTRIQYGVKRKDFTVSLTEPYFMDQKLSLGGELFYRDANYVSSVYSQSNAGFAVNMRRPLGKFASLRAEYRLEHIGINDVDEGASEQIKDAEGNYLKSGVTGGVNYDTRDSLFLTRRGERIDFQLYGAGLGGDVKDYGFDLEASKYFSLKWDTILLLTGQISGVDSFGGDGVPIFDRLYLGGANSLRGFSYRDVGPKDDHGEPIGGQALARATVEYTFPIADRVRGAVFYDVGYVNSGAWDFSPSDVASDAGLGVRLDLPIGPVRIDYGVPVSGGDGGSGKFNFNVGYQF